MTNNNEPGCYTYVYLSCNILVNVKYWLDISNWYFSPDPSHFLYYFIDYVQHKYQPFKQQCAAVPWPQHLTNSGDALASQLTSSWGCNWFTVGWGCLGKINFPSEYKIFLFLIHALDLFLYIFHERTFPKCLETSGKKPNLSQSYISMFHPNCKKVIFSTVCWLRKGKSWGHLASFLQLGFDSIKFTRRNWAWGHIYICKEGSKAFSSSLKLPLNGRIQSLSDANSLFLRVRKIC